MKHWTLAEAYEAFRHLREFFATDPKTEQTYENVHSKKADRKRQMSEPVHAA